MIHIVKYTRDNYEEALKMTVSESQKHFVPSVAESLMYAYIKPWDACLDPHLIYDESQMIGSFYISYTPSSVDDYWIGGFFIDQAYQDRGLGKLAFEEILNFIRSSFDNCQVIQLTVEASNHKAAEFYKKFGFESQGNANKEGEVIYQLRIKKTSK